MCMKRNVVRGLGTPCESALRKKLHELEMQEPDGPIEEEMRHIAAVNNLIGASRGDLHGHLEAVREVRGMLLDKVSQRRSKEVKAAARAAGLTIDDYSRIIDAVYDIEQSIQAGICPLANPIPEDCLLRVLTTPTEFILRQDEGSVFRSDGYKRISVDERATKLTGDVLDAISTLAIRGARSCFTLQGVGPSEAGKTWLRVFQHLQRVGGRRLLSYTEGEAKEVVRLIDAAVSLQFAERMESFLLKNIRQQGLSHYMSKVVVEYDPRARKLVLFNGFAMDGSDVGSEHVWNVVDQLVRTQDPDGYATLDKGWRARFVRKTAEGEIDMSKKSSQLDLFIWSEEGCGSRGSGRYRICLSQRPRAKQSKQMV